MYPAGRSMNVHSRTPTPAIAIVESDTNVNGQPCTLKLSVGAVVVAVIEIRPF